MMEKRTLLRKSFLLLVYLRAVDKPSPFFKLHDKIEEKAGWNGYADTDRRQAT